MIDIRQAYFLPLNFRIFGGLLTLFGLLLPVRVHHPAAQALGFLVCLLTGLLLITTRHGLSIDTDQKRYLEYVQIFGFKRGIWKPYHAIEKIFINPVKTSQVVYTRANQRSEFKGKEYTGYLKFADGLKIELDEDKSKARLLTRLNQYNKVLATQITDNS